MFEKRSTEMEGLSLVDIHKTFDGKPALTGVSFQVARSETVALLGPSGTGKSTLLWIIAGLMEPDQGQVLWDGVTLEGIPPHRRNFGLMFQDFALFPHMNVFENVAFGLRMKRLPPEKARERVLETLGLVGLSGFGERDPNTLSGGEQQRVALARSLAPQPRLLMLDEPLGSLDRNLRERLVLDLRKILDQMNQTALYVTHDQEEAFTIAHRVVIIKEGHPEQIGTPEDIYRRPASAFVARFLGLNNLIPAVIQHEKGRPVAVTPVGRLPVNTQAQGEVTVLLRPDQVRLDGQGECQIEGIVTETSFRGSTYRAVVQVDSLPLTFDFPSTTRLPQRDERVQLSFDPDEALQIFPRD